MTLKDSVLTDKSLVIVFAYAPAGLGHLRVSDTLYHGLPKGVIPVLLGSDDRSISFLHRITSVHPLGRRLMEIFQGGKAEDLFSYFYRNFLRSRSEDLYKKLNVVLEQRIDVPKKVLMVATHFGLAHQLSAIKERVAKDLKVQVILAVVVTDDSPQHIWYVPQADITFVPSLYTRTKLEEYGIAGSFPRHRFEVVPYPLNPLLAKALLKEQWQKKRNQLKYNASDNIHISVPISGAAVGTDYIKNLILNLHEKSERYVFHIVSKLSFYTRSFLNTMSGYPFVRLKVALSDRETVNDYDDLFSGNIISLEITKPSEQAFKSLLPPDTMGGPIMLFAKPLGRQEYDNINFLKKHGLIPSSREGDKIKKLKDMTKNNRKNFLGKFKKSASCFRGIELPDEPVDSAYVINTFLENGILLNMTDYKCQKDSATYRHEEVAPDGVEKIWQILAEYIRSMR